MAGEVLTALREARSALDSAATAEPVEAPVAKKFAREIGEVIARFEGKPPERDLVSIVCHDLKDPLASIVMGAGFLKRTVAAEDESARRVVEAIARSADRMNQVVTDFHDLAKIEAGNLGIDLRPCEVACAIEGAVSSFAGQARDRGVALRFEAADAPVALCDRNRVVQIVSKLLSNALKFTEPGGEVVVRVERDGDHVRVSVRDTGRGIPSHCLEEIFDRAANARRTPRDGPGLGLAIARGLVELQGGSIGVKSRVSEGSLFWFLLKAG
jgi:signal transduction histidine kinase